MSLFCFLLILALLFDNFFMQKRHVCEIGQCFGELYLKAMYFSSTYLVLFFKYVRPNLIIFSLFFVFVLLYGIKKGLDCWMIFFSSQLFFFSVAVFGFFWLLYLFNFIQKFWNSTIIIYKVMYNRDHECHQMVKCIIIILLH